jgi:uncharacterized protein YkwD
MKNQNMKNLLLILIVFPLSVRSQVIVNQDSLTYYFQQIINNYRRLHNLQPIIAEPQLRNHAEYWSKRMAEMGKCGHGEADENFSNRTLRNTYLNNKSYKVENCAAMVSLSQKLANVNINVPFFKANTEIETLTKRAYNHDLNQYEIAYYVFVMWKNSPSHNLAMLESIIKYFNLASNPNKSQTYFCFVATS